ncbi:MAG: DNA-binding protein [Verrucomicrobia bacterium]|nr:DNA-binding protein [Verrucomicrobiota bacterium]
MTAWSAWQPIAGLAPLTADVLAETLDGGQAFRWQRQPDATYQGQWAHHLARVRLAPSGQPEWSAPAPLAASVGPALRPYLGLDRDFPALTDSLPWRSDPHLATCLAAFPGLRILRQPFGETLLGFLCSATKQIVQIKQMVALLAANHGTPLSLSPGGSELRPSTADRSASSALPTWSALATVPEATLRSCLLGFRARYISQTAQFLAAHPGWLEETEALPYAAAKERLCSLPGVGEKVADCVLLFGAGRLEAFPVDVWIIKTMERRYGLTGWKPAQIAHFGRTHFGPLAGLAQQYLFAWERKASRG